MHAAREPLTPVESRVYEFLLDFLATHTFQPSVREIGRRCGLRSTKTVSDVLHALADKGYVERVAGRSRGLKLVGYESVGGAHPVPVVEQQATTWPTHLAVDRSFLAARDIVLVESPSRLVDAAIELGDLLMVSPATRAKESEPMVIRVRGRLVVRRVSHRGPVLVLEATHDVPEQQLGSEDVFEVLGVVLGVLRASRGPARPAP